MPFKPLLASHCTDTEKLRLPLLASRKLDGVRMTVQGGKLLSRSLKEIPNRNVQDMFADLPNGIDGEAIVGDPCAPDAYRRTVSVVMSDDKPADDVRFWLFDWHGSETFEERLEKLQQIDHPMTELVEHIIVRTLVELDALEAAWLEAGNEGVMLRAIDGRYKEGRSSEKEQILLKLKRFSDSEAVVIGTYELEHNSNDSFINELGRTARSSAQAGKVGLDTLGGFFVRGSAGQPFDGVEFKVGNGQGMTQELRKQLWADRESLVGRTIKIKYFPTGGKDRPRHPLWLGWRDERDM